MAACRPTPNMLLVCSVGAALKAVAGCSAACSQIQGHPLPCSPSKPHPPLVAAAAVEGGRQVGGQHKQEGELVLARRDAACWPQRDLDSEEFVSPTVIHCTRRCAGAAVDGVRKLPRCMHASLHTCIHRPSPACCQNGRKADPPTWDGTCPQKAPRTHPRCTPHNAGWPELIAHLCSILSHNRCRSGSRPAPGHQSPSAAAAPPSAGCARWSSECAQSPGEGWGTFGSRITAVCEGTAVCAQATLLPRHQVA